MNEHAAALALATILDLQESVQRLRAQLGQAIGRAETAEAKLATDDLERAWDGK